MAKISNQSRELPAKLCRKNPTGNICQNMLACRQRRKTDGDRGHQCKDTISDREPLILAYTYPAKPTDRAVDRRKEIVRLIDLVEKPHNIAPEAGSGNYRPVYFRGKQQEKEEADGFNQKIRRIKPAGHAA